MSKNQITFHQVSGSQNRTDRHTAVRTGMFLFSLFAMLVGGFGAAQAQVNGGGLCNAALMVALNGAVEENLFTSAPRCYTVEVPSAGWWLLEADLMRGETSLNVALDMPRACNPWADSAGVSLIEGTASAMLLEVRTPGIYGFCVSRKDTDDAAPWNDSARLTVRSELVALDDDPKEEETQPDSARPIVDLSEDDPKEEETQPDAVGPVAGLSDEDPKEEETQPDAAPAMNASF